MATLNSNTRTTPSEVQEIFETELSTDSLIHHINAAAERVDDIAEVGGVSDQRLELIEEYLAAHVASTQDPRVSDESIADVSFTYKGASETTDYWEMAEELDPTGTLAEPDGEAESEADVGLFTSTDYE